MKNTKSNSYFEVVYLFSTGVMIPLSSLIALSPLLWVVFDGDGYYHLSIIIAIVSFVFYFICTYCRSTYFYSKKRNYL